MHIERRFAPADPYASIAFAPRPVEIRGPDGAVVYANPAVEAPAHWSQVAVDVLAQKYFRKAGVPARTRPVAEKTCLVRRRRSAMVRTGEDITLSWRCASRSLRAIERASSSALISAETSEVFAKSRSV